jgi:hypothetical protein
LDQGEVTPAAAPSVPPKPPDGVVRRKKKSKACSDNRLAGAPSAATAPMGRRLAVYERG